jgi:hypothetical protein
METEKTGRGPKISREVRQLIIGQAIHDSKNMPRRALALRLQDIIEKMGEISPTEDTLARLISEARNKQPSELDQPWSIGANAQYNIPPDIIPVLIRLQRFRRTNQRKGGWGELTIREARWFARLYPVAEPIGNKTLIDDNGRLWLLSLIVSCYVQRERISEQMNEQYPNTSELDRLFFANEDVLSNNSLEAWWSIFPPEYQKAVADELEPRRLLAVAELEKIRGRSLSGEEAEVINTCFDIARKNGPLALREWVKQHPIAQEINMADLDWGTIYSEAIMEDLK